MNEVEKGIKSLILVLVVVLSVFALSCEKSFDIFMILFLVMGLPLFSFFLTINPTK